jgi:hypothetical protein
MARVTTKYPRNVRIPLGERAADAHRGRQQLAPGTPHPSLEAPPRRRGI